jgi:hypothetical protein
MEERHNTPTLGSTSSGGGMQANAGGIAGRVREQATAQLSRQKDRATDGLGTVAQAVRGTTEHLRSQQHDTVAQYAEQAAQQIERLSERLRSKDVGELMQDAQQLARRQPALFVGGAFAIGLLGARFLKSSAPSGGWRRDLPVPYETTGGTYPLTSAATEANAYGNTVPRSATSASTLDARTSPTRGGRDFPPTEDY